MRLRLRWVVLLMLIGLLMPIRVQAADLFVTRTGSGSGSCPTGTPCTLQRAFDIVNPGDQILLRSDATPYDGHFVLTRSGTSGAGRITIKPDAGHTPVIRWTGNDTQDAAIVLKEVSYITVRDVTLNGAGVSTSAYGIWIMATVDQGTGDGTDVFGIEILNNQFLNWGGTAAQSSTHATRAALLISGGWCPITGGCTWKPHDTLVQGNTFTNNRQTAIYILHADNTRVEQNTISGMTCGNYNDAIATLGIKVADAPASGTVSTGTIIRQNTLFDWEPQASCGVTHEAATTDTFAAIWCDVGPKQGLVERNLVYNINQADTVDVGRASQGIFIEAGCSDWIIRNNVVHDVGTTCLRQRIGNYTEPANSWLNNTCYNTNHNGIQVATGKSFVQNNILFNAGIAQIHFDTADVGQHTVNNNLYFDLTGAPNGSKVGQWGGSTLNFAAWKSACSCDANAINLNPNVVNLTTGSWDFRLCLDGDTPNVSCVGASPAIGAGATLANVTEDYTGAPRTVPYDIGAYESGAGGTTIPAAPTNLRVVSP